MAPMTIADLNKAATEFIKKNGKRPKSLTVGVAEANEIIHFVAECYPNCEYRYGFHLVQETFELEKIQVVLKKSMIQFD